MVHFDVSNVVRALDEMKIKFSFLDLNFKEPAGTSRGVMHSKPSWFIEVIHNGKTGVGEISIIPGLSPEFQDILTFEKKLQEVITQFSQIPIELWMENEDEITFQPVLERELIAFPAIRFGFEMAYFSWLGQNGHFFVTPDAFNHIKIPTNGLVWMGDIPTMRARMKQKLEEGFTTVKMKIGGLDWELEKPLLSELRSLFSDQELTIRVDANGALTEQNAEFILRDLKELNIHSIEQPLKKGKVKETILLNKLKLVDIAFDEELIGIEEQQEMLALLKTTGISYIVIKPSLHGGFRGAKKWISCAEKLGIGWWITSALESSLGLQAIAEFTSVYEVNIPQGLGTGSIYTNNLPTRFVIKDGFLSAIE